MLQQGSNEHQQQQQKKIPNISILKFSGNFVGVNLKLDSPFFLPFSSFFSNQSSAKRWWQSVLYSDELDKDRWWKFFFLFSFKKMETDFPLESKKKKRDTTCENWMLVTRQEVPAKIKSLNSVLTNVNHRLVILELVERFSYVSFISSLILRLATMFNNLCLHWMLKSSVFIFVFH